jgi:hypothetical protein
MSGDPNSIPPGLTLSEVIDIIPNKFESTKKVYDNDGIRISTPEIIVTPSSYMFPEGEKLNFPPLPSLPQNVTSDKSSSKKTKEKEKEKGIIKKEEVDDWGTLIDHLWGDSDGKEDDNVDNEDTPWGDTSMNENNEEETKGKWIFISGAGDYDDIDSQVNFNNMIESFKDD